MKKTSILLGGFMFLLLLVNSAWACYPTITASAYCDANTHAAMINYTSTSWLTDSDGANSNIGVYFNDFLVDNGSYTAPNFSFTNTKPAPSAAGPGSTVTVMATALGVWGNGTGPGQSSSVTVTIPDANTDPNCVQPGMGRFTGGGQQVRVGTARFNKGLTIHCDLLLSNNLEVNWQGNNFHMTEHLYTVACTDDPDIHQAPPAAPLDTLKGVGTGRYNNEDGYMIDFTLVDAGEPGTSDMAAIKIYKGSDTPVLDVPLSLIDSGNLQAHYDQPHK